MMGKRTLCMSLGIVVLVWGLAVVTQGTQVISWDALSVTGVDSHYKAFYQTLPLWELGDLTIDGGIGVTAWEECGWFSCSWNTYPTLLTRARISLFTAPMIDVYNISWLSASISHGGKLLPEFRRVDLFTAVGIDFQWSPGLSIHGELGFPIGWPSVPTTIGLGFSLRFGQVGEGPSPPLGPLKEGE